MQRGLCFAGTPDPVYKKIKTFYDHVGGFGHLLIMGQAGFLDHDETVAGISGFAREVYPGPQGEISGHAGFRRVRDRGHARRIGASSAPLRGLVGDRQVGIFRDVDTSLEKPLLRPRTEVMRYGLKIGSDIGLEARRYRRCRKLPGRSSM